LENGLISQRKIRGADKGRKITIREAATVNRCYLGQANLAKSGNEKVYPRQKRIFYLRQGEKNKKVKNLNVN